MFQVKLLNSNAVVPTRGTPNSAGLDISSSESTEIPSRKWKAISTGLSISVPADCYARIAPRSGLAYKFGIDVFAGVVDSDYTGEVKVILMNNGDEPFKVNIGDRIAQIIFEKIFTDGFVEVEELNSTQRGSGGFGSTGK